jgi:hypothetical protein
MLKAFRPPPTIAAMTHAIPADSNIVCTSPPGTVLKVVHLMGVAERSPRCARPPGNARTRHRAQREALARKVATMEVA